MNFFITHIISKYEEIYKFFIVHIINKYEEIFLYKTSQRTSILSETQFVRDVIDGHL